MADLIQNYSFSFSGQPRTQNSELPHPSRLSYAASLTTELFRLSSESVPMHTFYFKNLSHT